ncbi:hypothetical protein ASE21_18450 [Flavobacterium sp. Root901]|uniref:glycosyltransferase family 2 protein n=1 Tax=Flavobacterium sp. Root901 TaxID=1736605 RepID=UPI00070BAEBD|nr:glycosyltransferase family 2 protein [Flavobacterium sp. Root901]KRD07467.1 hypothetical protein ASE21_18450 [Flavobacterium sp. Root901]
MPKVSVILPVYNCEKYIRESIESVLNQTFEDFELLIIDDCSTDSTVAIIENFDDSRINLIRKEKNTGLIYSLNYAVSIAKGEYIARMDGDDICLPQRFEKQLKFLEQNPNIILCGSAIQIINENTILRHPLFHEEIIIKLCFTTSFCHPSVMGKTAVFKENLYDIKYKHAEDYDLWTRLAFKGELANLEEVLLLYRSHEEQVSQANNVHQTTVGYSSQFRMFESIINFENDIYKKMHIAFKKQDHYTIDDFKKSLILFNLLQKGNVKKKIYDNKLFNNQLKKIRLNFLKNYFRTERIQIKLFLSYCKMIKIEDFIKLIKYRFKK